MRKSTILVYWVGGLLFTVIGGVLLFQTPPQEIEAPTSLQSPVMIPVFLLVIASVANLIAWIGALVLLIRLGAWGWFLAVFLLSGIGMLSFLIFGPDQYVPGNDYEDYDVLPGYGDPGAPMP